MPIVAIQAGQYGLTSGNHDIHLNKDEVNPTAGTEISGPNNPGSTGTEGTIQVPLQQVVSAEREH